MIEQPQTSWLISLLSALSGALIGGFCTGLATYVFNKKHRIELDNNNRQYLAKALSTELSCLWARYMDLAGNEVENNGQEPLLIEFPQTFRNYFVVFDSSSNQLGLFEQDVAQKVIEAYINAKALLDELVEYGELTSRYKSAEREGGISAELARELDDFFWHFRTRHFEIKNFFEDAITILKDVN